MAQSQQSGEEKNLNLRGGMFFSPLPHAVCRMIINIRQDSVAELRCIFATAPAAAMLAVRFPVLLVTTSSRGCLLLHDSDERRGQRVVQDFLFVVVYALVFRGIPVASCVWPRGAT